MSVQAKEMGQERHAIHRAMQRYGLRVAHDDYEGLIHQIKQKCNAWFIRKVHDDHRLEVWYVLFCGKAMRAVYDTRTERIATFLPIS